MEDFIEKLKTCAEVVIFGLCVINVAQGGERGLAEFEENIRASMPNGKLSEAQGEYVASIVAKVRSLLAKKVEFKPYTP